MMEISFENMTVDCLKQLRQEVRSEEQTQEVRLSESMPDVGKVLGAWGQPLIRSKQWQGNAVSVSGGVMVWILYTPEDGSAVQSVETWVPFQMRWDLPDSQRDGTITVCCNLRGIDARSTSPRKIMARINLSMMLQAMEPVQVGVPQSVKLPEDVLLRREAYPVQIPSEAGEKPFMMDEELNLPGSCPPVAKLLRYCLQPELIDKKVMADKVVFRGMAILRLVYAAEDGGVKTWDFEIPFSQYAELEREHGNGSQCAVIPVLTSMELDTEGESRIRLKAGLTGQYMIYDTVPVEAVTDAYSTRRQVTVQKQQIPLPILLEMRRELRHVEQTLDRPARQAVDTALYGCHPALRRQAEGRELTMEGLLQTLFYDEEGKIQCAVSRWEDRWMMDAGEDVRIDGVAMAAGMSQATAGGGRLESRGDMAAELFTMDEKGLEMVTGLELGELTTADPGRPTLLLRRAGEQTLWELAKETGSTEEAIRSANGLSGEPEHGKMLLIPVL
ncbi:MAG: DUF3794 domain-containing protein [Oscillospiraceae bacterium]|nr:DUF3794 domain-containing protein [Oscillospiraceae bacterium]MBQ9837993.1 DUF3794 domain-containing protein [Oscillospiraceae bacterium]